MRCHYCDKEHDTTDIEPGFRLPDEVAAMGALERKARVSATKDACRLRDLEGSEERYFLRVLMPFAVHGRARPCSWGIWAEVSREDYETTEELWLDPTQHLHPPFPGLLANAVWGYEASLGLAGSIQLKSPTSIATFVLDDRDHPLAAEQRTGVSEATVVLWLEPIFHPEASIQALLPPS